MNNGSIYYLEMTSAGQLKEKNASNHLVIRECKIKQYQVNRFLYQLVGETWQWLDKNGWSDTQWAQYAEDENLRTWIAYFQDSPAGYFELKQLANDTIEIAYFGLAPKFIGHGHGGHLLSQAIKTSWQYPDCKRVIVNTCTLDHPNALANYQARGMMIYDTQPLEN